MTTPFSMILLDNNRSKAYLQSLIRAGYVPAAALVLGIQQSAEVTKQKFANRLFGLDAWFDEKKSIYSSLEEAEIPYTCIPHLDANKEDVVKTVAKMPGKHLIYSGPGGVILHKPILNVGKVFFHAHPGIVPRYKGSTTIYYSMLLEKSIGCSVIIMSEELDGGDVVFQENYPVPSPPIDYDNVVDPLVRVETILRWLRSINGDMSSCRAIEQTDEGNTFYIIHPVLKHIAIMQNGGINSKDGGGVK